MITPERVAINVDDARIEDNEGNRPIEQTIVPDGPAAYFSTLPIQGMVEAMLERGIPASISNTAGTFVCNHLMYFVLHYLAQNQQNLPAGFIHLPYLPVQVLDRANIASMGLETMVEGIGICLDVLVKNVEG
jgi:pyroglutamyl-peptidase